MTVSGTVTRVTRRVKSYGSVHMTVEIDGRKWKYLQGSQPVPKRGQKVEISGMPMVGFKDVNIGAAEVRVIAS